MIGVLGHMSSGKTYYAVEQILKWLASGHVVVSNIRLNCLATSKFLHRPCLDWRRQFYTLVDSDKKELGYHEIHVDDYDSFPAGLPRGSPGYESSIVYIVFDEASSLFDSMVKAADAQIQAVSIWARHSKKRGQEVFLIQQFENELNKRLRVHIEYYVKCRNFGAYFAVGGVGVPSWMKSVFIRMRLDSEAEHAIGIPTLTAFNPRLAACYNTSQILVGSDFESTLFYVDRTPVLLRHYLIYLLFLTLVSFVCLFLVLCYA